MRQVDGSADDGKYSKSRVNKVQKTKTNISVSLQCETYLLSIVYCSQKIAPDCTNLPLIVPSLIIHRGSMYKFNYNNWLKSSLAN